MGQARLEAARPADGLGVAQGMWALVRANIVIPERPDRLPRAMVAALPYGSGLLASVAGATASYPRRTAVIGEAGGLSYRELWRGAAALASGLADMEFTAHCRVGILCRNSPMFVQALLAVAMLGADVVFLNTAHGAEQLNATVAAEGLDVVLCDDAFSAVLDAPRVVPGNAVRELIAAQPHPRVRIPARRSRLIILTSGTTGRPKGAVRPSGGSAVLGVGALLERIPLRAADTVVLPAPFFHAWGLSTLMIALGLSSTVVTAPEFDASHTLELISTHRARVLIVVPTMLQRICTLPAEQLAAVDTDALEVIVSSGSALPGSLATEVLNRFGPVLYNVYGSTEVATASIATPIDLRDEPSSAGRPAAGVLVKILDAAGRAVEDRARGRIFVGGAARFEGYTGGGGKEVIAGLVSSGDVGHFDAQGRLFVDGREDDMIVSGGENVYPAEVEQVLGEHPRIDEAVVVGVPDERFGQALKAVVVCRPGQVVRADELKEYVARRLARYKVPRSFEFVESLPRTATGKVLRRELV
jgi:fatty-acyl-CoA synthase